MSRSLINIVKYWVFLNNADGSKETNTHTYVNTIQTCMKYKLFDSQNIVDGIVKRYNDNSDIYLFKHYPFTIYFWWFLDF